MKGCAIEGLLCMVLVMVTSVNPWELVFKAASNGRGSAYDLFMDESTAHNDNGDGRSLSNTFQHFKSDIINNWNTLDIDKVQLAIYKQGLKKAFFVFDGKGSNRTSWFRREKLLNTSYNYKDIMDTDGTKFGFYFSLSGFMWRRFYMSKEWFECLDTGWLLLKESQGDCPWERNLQTPAIVYSTTETFASFGDERTFDTADSLAIFVTFQTSVCTPLPVCSVPVALHDSMFCYSPCNDVTTADSYIPTTERYVSSSADYSSYQWSVEQVKINKKDTNRYKRTLSCAKDNRFSSRALGLFGAIVISCAIGVIISMDCMECFIKQKEKPSSGRTKPKTDCR